MLPRKRGAGNHLLSYGAPELGGTCWSSGEHLTKKAGVITRVNTQMASSAEREHSLSIQSTEPLKYPPGTVCLDIHHTHIHQSQTNYSRQVKAKPVSVLEECTEYLITLE